MAEPEKVVELPRGEHKPDEKTLPEASPHVQDKPLNETVKIHESELKKIRWLQEHNRNLRKKKAEEEKQQAAEHRKKLDEQNKGK